MELNLLARSGLQVNALEAAQCTQGCAGYVGKLQVYLRDLVSLELSNVGYCRANSEGIGWTDRRGRQGQATVLERRVAQSIAEGPQRLLLEVPVGAALHGVIFEVRQLVHVLIERNGQASGWVVAAAQGGGNRCSTLFAWVPGFQDRVGM